MKQNMKKRGLLLTVLFCILLLMSAMTVQAAAKPTGWVRSGRNYKYKINNTYVKNKVQKVGKKYYYFDKKGIRRTGWISFKGNKYYFDKKKAYAYTGKKQIDKNLYIFQKDGKLVRKTGLYKYGKYQYGIKSNGQLAIGPTKIKNKWYYFENNGAMATKNGTRTWKEKIYYVHGGALVSGWVTNGRYNRHFNTHNYTLDTGLVKIDEKYYYFDENGRPKTGVFELSGAKYYFDESGERKHGLITIGSNQYYFGTDGKMVTNSYLNINGKLYYVDETGRTKKNCWFGGRYFNSRGQAVDTAVSYGPSTKGEVTDEMLDALSLTGCTKLMVAAHPDDETLWGGGHLTEGGWFVVCLTNGYDATRRNEFYSVMKESGNQGLILSYPDLQNGKRSDWIDVKPQIAKDLDTIMTYKHWGMVATHNPNGEYGHAHHKMTSELVTESYYRNYWGNALFYFGKHYNKTTLPKVEAGLTRLPDAVVTKKKELLSLYVSQSGAVNDHIHMAPYENWIRADKW